MHLFHKASRGVSVQMSRQSQAGSDCHVNDAGLQVLHAELKVMKDEVMEYQRHAYATRPSHPMDED